MFSISWGVGFLGLFNAFVPVDIVPIIPVTILCLG